VTRETVTRGDPHSHCESDSTEDTFTAGPRPDLPRTSAHANDAAPPSSSTLGTDIAVGAVGLGILGGTIYCAVKCPDPWDTAVPASVGGALALALIVALATVDWSRFVVVR
jgi:hypothetical protein